jgi:hypothetical protein
VVEVRNGSVWQKRPELYPEGRFLSPHSPGVETFQMPDLPTGVPLRVRFLVEKEVTGLESLGLWFNLRFRHGRKEISLNPFKAIPNDYGNSTEVMSDEFVVPVQK